MLLVVRGFHVMTLWEVPVSISPFYLLLLFFFGRGDLRTGLMWAVVITVGLLVHEFGHALVARYFRLQPAVTLHGFGGLTHHQRAERNVEDALIIAMGPAAGLVLGLLGIPAFYALRSYAPELDAGSLRTAYYALYAFFFVNVGWSVVNLLPLWPLDGGQLARLGLQKVTSPARADRITHQVGIALSGVLMIALYNLGATITLLILGLLAFQNYQALRGRVASGAVRPSERGERDLLAEAKAAFDAGHYAEAARKCHQLRAMSHASADVMEQVWTLLGLSAFHQGEHEEALSYLKRAPNSRQVQHATRESLAVLGREDELGAYDARQQHRRRGRYAARWLTATLVFYAVAVSIELPFLLRFL